MTPGALETLLEELCAGKLSISQTVEKIEANTIERLGELARIDHERATRTGTPEIIYGAGKTADQIAAILEAMDTEGAGALATRVTSDKAARVLAKTPRARYDEEAGCLVIDPKERDNRGRGVVAVVCAGTSDLGVAREAEVSLEFLGHETISYHDIGVAGLERLLQVIPELRQCQAVIAIAGMEGALPTVLAGLVACPVIAVPTSVGYGVGSHGLAALMGMLTSCAPGLTVVNIDNGVGAAIAAARMNRRDRGL